VADVRHAFNKRGGNLGTDGSVAYLFSRKGQLVYAPGIDEDALMETALEAGAEDVVSHDDGSNEVLTEFGDFMAVKDAMLAAGFKHEAADTVMLATLNVELDVAGAEALLGLVDMLEDLDDVQQVHTNAQIPQAVLDQLS
jgi:transcriptional/translational regulatory protein YebC/TACO1